MPIWESLDKVTVTTSGTPVRATQNETDPAARKECHALLFQQIPSNSGRIYILDSSSGNISTLEGCLAILAAPTTNVLQSASVTITNTQNAINIADYYVDAQNSGEGVLISAIFL